VPVHRSRPEIRHEEALERHDLAQQHARRRAIAVPVRVRAGDVHVECRRYERVVSRRPGVLLPEKVNRSLQAKPDAQKRDKHLADNLLAGSLHPATHGTTPVSRTGRRAKVCRSRRNDDFTAEAIEERQDLYWRLSQLVWSPERIRSRLGAAVAG
jgi:hypothetical protein